MKFHTFEYKWTFISFAKFICLTDKDTPNSPAARARGTYAGYLSPVQHQASWATVCPLCGDCSTSTTTTFTHALNERKFKWIFWTPVRYQANERQSIERNDDWEKSNHLINVCSVNASKGPFLGYFLPLKRLDIRGIFWEIILWK